MDNDKQLTTQEQNLNVIPMARLEGFQKSLSEKPKDKEFQELNGVKYLPISFVENKLREFYMGLVQMYPTESKIVANEFVVHAEIKVFHPVLQQWLTYGGIGASVIQQAANTPLADFVNQKVKNALEKNAPKAYAMAIKNAAAKIGPAFGSEANRKHEDTYETIYSDEVEFNQMSKRLEMDLSICDTDKDIMAYFKQEWASNERIKDIFRKHRLRVKNAAPKA